MGDFKEFLRHDEGGLGKFLINLGRRTGLVSPDHSNEPWAAPGAIPPQFAKGWQQILMSGKVGMEAWKEFQQLMSTPAGRYHLQKANANFNHRTDNPHRGDGDEKISYNQQYGTDFDKPMKLGSN